MADKIRVGFIGSGGIAVHHAIQLLTTAGDLGEIVALADPSEQSLAHMKEKRPDLANVPTFSDHRQMLAQVPMDAVEIHSPHNAHTQQILDSLDKGLHVLCEKPLSSTVADSRRVIAKRDETGKILMVSYQRHFQPMYRYIREQIQTGALGEVQTVVVMMAQEWLRATRGAWRQDPALSLGGQLNDSGSHLVDMFLWTTGLQAKKVYAEINNFDAKVDIDSTLTVRFTNGAIGNVTVLGNAPQGFWELFGVWGSKGSIIYDMLHGLRQQMFDQPEQNLEFPKPDNNPDLNFLRAILGQEEIQVPAECGLRVSELTEAAWRSAAQGRAIEVSEM